MELWARHSCVRFKTIVDLTAVLFFQGQYIATAVVKLSSVKKKKDKTPKKLPSQEDDNSIPFAVWIMNALRGIPTEEDLRKAYFWESRRIAEQETGKLLTQKRLTRLERLWKANWFSSVKVRVANTKRSSKTKKKDWHWEDAFAVVHGRRLLIWDSESDFDEGNPPIERLFLSGHAGLAGLSPLDMRDLSKEELPLVVSIFGRGMEGQQKLTLLMPDAKTKDSLDDTVIAASLKKE